MEYDEYTAGGMMTTEPLIVAPETPVAHCLAMISREELHAALASTVHVCRSPLETPSGRLLGIVHFQQLLRRGPHRDPVGVQDLPDGTVRALAQQLLEVRWPPTTWSP